MPIPTDLQDTFGPWPGETDGTSGATPPDGSGPTTQVIVDAATPFWVGNEELWDTVGIAGVRIPGKVEVDGELKRKLDKQNAKGIDGLTISDDGEDEAPIQIVVLIWTAEQWRLFLSIVPLISPKGKQKRTAVSIDWPGLSMWGITQVYIEAVSTPKRSTSMPQAREITIRATEWRAPPKAAKSTSSKKPDDSTDSPKDLRATETRTITDDSGNVVAYEDTPIYEPDTEPDTDP